MKKLKKVESTLRFRNGDFRRKKSMETRKGQEVKIGDRVV